ncbi:MAG: hypothetical protein UHN88_01035 [Eubacterium sp.]|nr:hypothetical protein [Eubacterium sp.]
MDNNLRKELVLATGFTYDKNANLLWGIRSGYLFLVGMDNTGNLQIRFSVTRGENGVSMADFANMGAQIFGNGTVVALTWAIPAGNPAGQTAAFAESQLQGLPGYLNGKGYRNCCQHCGSVGSTIFHMNGREPEMVCLTCAAGGLGLKLEQRSAGVTPQNGPTAPQTGGPADANPQFGGRRTADPRFGGPTTANPFETQSRFGNNAGGVNHMAPTPYKAPKENVLFGILGALIGGAIGFGLMLALDCIGYWPFPGAIIMGIASTFLYLKFAGHISWKGVIVVVAVCVFCAYAVERVSWAIELIKQLKEIGEEATFGEAFRYIPYMVEDELVDAGSYYANYIVNMALAGASGLVSAICATRNRG